MGQQNFSRIPISTNWWQRISIKNYVRLLFYLRILLGEYPRKKLLIFLWRICYYVCNPPIFNLSFNQVYGLTFCNRILHADFIHKDFFITPQYCLHYGDMGCWVSKRGVCICTKLERFLSKNKYSKRKWLYFVRLS